MPNYVQVSELGKYFPASRIIDLAGGDSSTETLSTLAAATEARLEERIVSAEAEADAYLQGRFALPISPVPERLKLAVGKIAVYLLFEDRPELWQTTNPQQKQYDSQIDWLEGVKEEDLFVGNENVQSDSDDILGTADGTDDNRVFAGGGLNDF